MNDLPGMQVSELIEMLQKLPQDAPVCISAHPDEDYSHWQLFTVRLGDAWVMNEDGEASPYVYDEAGNETEVTDETPGAFRPVLLERE